MKQSAVQWFVEQIETIIKNGYVFNPKWEEDFIEQAKEMEKQQIKDAWMNGYNSIGNENMIGGTGNEEKEYYDKTYKNKE